MHPSLNHYSHGYSWPHHSPHLKNTSTRPLCCCDSSFMGCHCLSHHDYHCLLWNRTNNNNHIGTAIQKTHNDIFNNKNKNLYNSPIIFFLLYNDPTIEHLLCSMPCLIVAVIPLSSITIFAFSLSLGAHPCGALCLPFW